MLISLLKNEHFIDSDLLNKDSVIVDGGACIGEFIEAVRKYVMCRIIAIEPLVNNSNKISGENIEIINAALVGKNQPSEVMFYSYPNIERGNIYNSRPGSDKKYLVKTITLPDLFKICPKIDYIKLDLEGAEKDLIETMTREEAEKIKQISLEFHYGYRKSRIINKLSSLGFSVMRLTNREVYVIKNQ